jgi:hypothetical protein
VRTICAPESFTERKIIHLGLSDYAMLVKSACRDGTTPVSLRCLYSDRRNGARFRTTTCKEATLMKVKTLVIATAMIALATGGAFAQSGSGMSGASSGSTMSQPEAGSNKAAPTAKDSQKMEMQKDKSPASTNAGTAQEK